MRDSKWWFIFGGGRGKRIGIRFELRASPLKPHLQSVLLWLFLR
jgi:hypothetical protein